MEPSSKRDKQSKKHRISQETNKKILQNATNLRITVCQNYLDKTDEGEKDQREEGQTLVK